MESDSVCHVQATCGGCPLLALDRRAEIASKISTLTQELKAVKIDVEIGFEERSNRFGYRNRLRMKVVDGRADFFNDAKRSGCPVVRPELWAAITHLRSVTTTHPEILDGVPYLEVRVGDDSAFGLFVPQKIETEQLLAELGPNWVVACDGETRPATLSYYLPDDVTVDVPLTSFVQVNSAVNRQLVQIVTDVADRTGAATFIDLFCGSGNFAIPLAERGLVGTAVDNVGAAIRELGRTTQAQRGRIRCIEGDARTVLEQLEPADLVIADPPRAGLQKNYGLLASLVSDILVLVGCKASSFAADVAALCASGLELSSVTALDMFPGTDHIEAVAILKRARS